MVSIFVSVDGILFVSFPCFFKLMVIVIGNSVTVALVHFTYLYLSLGE